VSIHFRLLSLYIYLSKATNSLLKIEAQTIHFYCVCLCLFIRSSSCVSFINHVAMCCFPLSSFIIIVRLSLPPCRYFVITLSLLFNANWIIFYVNLIDLCMIVREKFAINVLAINALLFQHTNTY